MARILKVQCCIAGGGPAGMMLGYLLGRAGVQTVVLEKHSDFLRDFRGDTVHPSTLRILQQLGLLQEFLKIPHSELRALSVEIGRRSLKVVDFGRLRPPGNFIALMPQWDFLDFLSQHGSRYPSLQVMMSTEVTTLISQAGRVVGVQAQAPDGPWEVQADLVVGCDGRSSTVRAASGLKVHDLGSPIDVLWFRMSKQPSDPDEVLGHLEVDKMMVTIDRGDYWQCAYVIAKGGFAHIQSLGLEAFRGSLIQGAAFLADRVGEISSFEDVKLLSVSLDRLTTWSKPGLLCIGDAAHAMSPVGGVGINLAIQDAVAAANLLAAKLKNASLTDADLDAVRRRRLMPVKVIQTLQAAIHNRILQPLISGQVGRLPVPWPVKLLNSIPWLRRWPAQLLGVGLRPERVRSPISAP
jgi:2-polyprenyl-6-methoxyphenol hydroxylase-like FAD-dependent oxidoreductase